MRVWYSPPPPCLSVKIFKTRHLGTGLNCKILKTKGLVCKIFKTNDLCRVFVPSQHNPEAGGFCFSYFYYTILASPVRSRPIGFPAKGVLMWIVRLALRFRSARLTGYSRCN